MDILSHLPVIKSTVTICHTFYFFQAKILIFFDKKLNAETGIRIFSILYIAEKQKSINTDEIRQAASLSKTYRRLKEVWKSYHPNAILH